MRVLAAVLPDAGRIALDVAGVERGAVEWWRQQQRQAVLALDQVFVNGGHRGRGADRIRGAGDYAPRLRDRIDSAFDVAGRAERRAVIEVPAPIPVAVPSVALERFRECRLVSPPRRSARILAANIRQRRKRHQRRVEEPSEPDALAFASLADAVHAVVPVARPEQRNTVDTDREASIERQRAMLEDGGALLGNRGLKERFSLAGIERRTVEEGHRFVEDAEVAGDLYIVSDRVRQPDAIVGDARANSLSGGRQPPMLHVAGDELARRRANQLFARQGRLRHRQRHHVLNLIAEA